MIPKWTEGNAVPSEKTPYVITINPVEKPRDLKIRIAAYARVSSASEDQHNSFEAQVKYYTTLISSKDNWSLVEIYADEGVTGTSAEKRKDFQRLLADCRRGLIDKILVKSISRFARNTKECLETIRELKLLGIGVQFEKENIDTSRISGELMTALFASFAQTESESISGNMRCSYQKRMQNGTFNTCYAPYGYRLENGKLVIQKDEAEVVRYIFSAYLNGTSSCQIAAYLAKHEQSNRQWKQKNVEYILQNERYAGNALLQKTYTTDMLPHQKKRNKGERTMYFIQESNLPIISEEIFEQVQNLRLVRKKKYTCNANPQSLSRVMLCWNCGRMLRTKQVREKIYMTCRVHERDLNACPLLPIPETDVHQAFLRLYYKLKHHGEFLAEMVESFQMLRNRRMLWSTDIVDLNKKISELYSQNQMLASLKQQGLIDPDFFISQSNELAEQIRTLKQKKEGMMETDKDEIIEKTEYILEVLEMGPDFLDSFDGELFAELIDCVIAESKHLLIFRLKNGLELTESIEGTV